MSLFITGGVASGAVITVPPGGDFQQALNLAESGDTITLAAGAVYEGNFTFPEKTGTSYVTITTSQAGSLPTEGQRITPANAGALPKVVTPNFAPAIASGPGAKHYKLRGLEVTVSAGVYSGDLISLGSRDDTQLTTFANDFIVDQCYIHGDANAGGKRGIALNGINIIVQNSYFSNFKSHFQDAQAICGWYGPGPFQIVNNYLEGDQGIMFGGAAPKLAGTVPSNIQIKHNYIRHPLSWQHVWPVKNLLELKNAEYVTISDNILENNWVSAQSGYGVLFTVRTCEAGNYSWAEVDHVTFTYNLIRNSVQGVNILGTDNVRQKCGGGVAGLTSNIVIRNNLFEQMGGTFLQLLSGAQNITVDHNTVIQQGDIMDLDGTPKDSGFVFTNNITMFGPYGVIGNGTIGALTTFAKFTTSYVYEANVAIDPVVGLINEYPAGNFFPPTIDDVGFVNPAAGDYRLAESSPYDDKGTDGKDIGADVASVLSATATVVSGAQP